MPVGMFPVVIGDIVPVFAVVPVFVRGFLFE